MKHFLAAAIAILVGASSACAVPAQPERTPAQAVELLLKDAEVRRTDFAIAPNDPYWREIRDLERVVSRGGDKSATAIREALKLPRDLADLTARDPTRRMACGPAVALVGLLDRDRADPLLKEFFGSCANAAQKSEAHARQAQAKWEADGGLQQKDAAAARAGVVDAYQMVGYFTERMADAIRVATDLKSPVLVEPILSFLEAGSDDRQGSRAYSYLLLFSGERQDILPRLKRIAADPTTPAAVKYEIQRAFDRCSKQRAAAQAGNQVVQTPPKAPALPAEPRR